MAVNVSSISYKVIVITEKGIQLNITDAVQSLGWEENENELAQKLSFELYDAKYKGDSISKLVKIGCVACVKSSYGGKTSVVAYGKIQEIEKMNTSQKYTYKVTAYDCLYDMQKSQDNIYFASGKKTSSIIKSICKSWSIPIGSYAGPDVSHSKVLFKNKAISDVIREIFDEAKKKGGGNGFLRSNKGKVEVHTIGDNKEVYVFTNAKSISSSYKASATDIVTRVKIATSAKEGEHPKIEATVNGKTQYGIRQKIVTRSSSESLADAKKEAQELIKEDGSLKYTRTVTAPDLPCVRKGDVVSLDVTSMDGLFSVKSIQHNADKGQMTMKVEKYTADNKNSSSSSKTSKNTEYEVTAKSGLNMRTGPNAKIITAIPYGKEVESDGKKDGSWLHVKYNGKWGWCFSKYLSKK